MDKEHLGLSPVYTTIDTAPSTHVSRGCRILTTEDVNRALDIAERDPDFDYEDL